MILLIYQPFYWQVLCNEVQQSRVCDVDSSFNTPVLLNRILCASFWIVCIDRSVNHGRLCMVLVWYPLQNWDFPDHVDSVSSPRRRLSVPGQHLRSTCAFSPADSVLTEILCGWDCGFVNGASTFLSSMHFINSRRQSDCTIYIFKIQLCDRDGVATEKQ